MIRRPRQVVDGREDAVVRLRAPDLGRVAAIREVRALCDVRDHDRETRAAGERVVEESGRADDARGVRLLLLSAATASATTAEVAVADRAATARDRRPGRRPDSTATLLPLTAERHAGLSQERDALAVGRPRRHAVAIDARRDVVHRALGDVVDGDER